MEQYITVKGRKYELIYTIGAMEQVEKAVGDTEGGLSGWLSAPSAAVSMQRAAKMLTILANAKAAKDRVEAAAGLFHGEPQPYLEEAALKTILKPGDIAEFQRVMMAAVADGFKATLPEDLEEKRDYDLEEIEGKNA